MDKKVNNSARTNNMSKKNSTANSSNITKTQQESQFSECPHQNTDSSESDEESVSEVWLGFGTKKSKFFT